MADRDDSLPSKNKCSTRLETGDGRGGGNNGDAVLHDQEEELAAVDHHLDRRAREADTVIGLLEEDNRQLRSRLAAEMVLNNRADEVKLRNRIKQLKAENSLLVKEKHEMTRKMASVMTAPAGRRADQNMLRCFLAACSVGEASEFLDEMNSTVMCSCISCFALKRRWGWLVFFCICLFKYL